MTRLQGVIDMVVRAAGGDEHTPRWIGIVTTAGVGLATAAVLAALVLAALGG